MFIQLCDIYRSSNGMIFLWGCPTMPERLIMIDYTISVKTVITNHVS